MNLREMFEFDLHSGEEINGMTRFNGHYLGEGEEDSQVIIFDNGNLYILKDEEVVKKIDGNDEFFIDKHIVKAIYGFLELNPALREKYNYIESNYQDNIEFCGDPKDEKRGSYILVRIVLNRQSKKIEISNIMIPLELKHNGFGKKLIFEIYKIAQKHKYKLYLVEMVESFYNRMVKRNAKIILPNDIVEITNDTKL